MKNIDEIPESVVLGSCLSLLSILGIYAWRNNSGALLDCRRRIVRFGLKGSSDIIGICPDGRFLAIECKRENGRVRPEQKKFIKKIIENKGVAAIVHNTDELMEVLKKEGVV